MGQWVNGQIVARLNRVYMPVTPFPEMFNGNRKAPVWRPTRPPSACRSVEVYRRLRSASQDFSHFRAPSLADGHRVAGKCEKFGLAPWRVHFFADFSRCGSLKELSAIDMQESSLSINNHRSHANQKPTILQALSHGA
jgi:hypothetical protein